MRSSGGVRIELAMKHIGILLRKAAFARQGLRGVHLGYGNIKANGLIVGVLNHDAHVDARLLPALAGTVDVPASAHEHVSGQRGAAGKMHQQPLAARLHAVDGLAGERRVVVEAREQRVSWSGSR